MTVYTAAAAESLKVSASNIVVTGSTTQVSETFVVGQQQAVRGVARIAQYEKLKIVGGASSIGVFHHMLISSLGFRARTTRGLSVVLQAIMQFAPMVRSSTLIRLVEAIELSARMGVSAIYRQQLGESLLAKSTVSIGWAKRLAERMGFSPNIADQLHAQVQATEEMILDTAVGHQLIVHIQHADTLSFDENLHVQALYKEQAIEIVTFGLKLHQPNGASTTWVINTRSGAITEYTDYAYRSFTRLPNGTYLGAGEDGNLYELQGDTDGNTPIVADIVGGMLDMGGSKFTQLKAVYLGMGRASGKFYMRLTTDNDVTRLYEVRVLPNRIARIDVGKGLRSRYIQWELISTGQDFDVQSIEFVPIVSRRRI